MPAMEYRIAVFGKPRAPWRATSDEAMADAIALELASWDASEREWFLAVPVGLQSRKVPMSASGGSDEADERSMFNIGRQA